MQHNQNPIITTQKYLNQKGHRPRWYLNRWRKYWVWQEVIIPAILAVAEAEERALINGDCAL